MISHSQGIMTDSQPVPPPVLEQIDGVFDTDLRPPKIQPPLLNLSGSKRDSSPPAVLSAQDECEEKNRATLSS